MEILYRFLHRFLLPLSKARDYKTMEKLIQDLYRFDEKGHKLTDFMRKSL